MADKNKTNFIACPQNLEIIEYWNNILILIKASNLFMIAQIFLHMR